MDNFQQLEMHEDNEGDKKLGSSQEEASSSKVAGDHLELEQWAENIVEAFNLQKKYEELKASQGKSQGRYSQKEKDVSNELEEDYGFSHAGLFLDDLQPGHEAGRYAEDEEDKCDYCDNKENYFYENDLIVQRLYSKYASSQNYYYTRDINEILCNGRTHAVIEFKDVQTADYEAEYLKRFYAAQEYQRKASLLMEYYKFHKDIPRLFMLPETIELNKFHDKKRRYDYYRIAQLIEEENEKNPQRPPKGIVGEKPPLRTNESSGQRSDDDEDDEEQPRNAEGAIIADNLLEDISSFNFKSVQSQQDEGKNHDRQNSPEDCQEKAAGLDAEISQFKVNSLNSQKYSRGTEKETEKNVQHKPRNQLKKDEQQSLTLQELNQKLEEIVTNQSQMNTSTFSISKISEEKNKYFDGKDLDHFLAFLNGNKQHQKIDISRAPQNNFKQYSEQQGLSLKQADNFVNNTKSNQQLTARNVARNKLPFQGLIDQQIQNSNTNTLKKNNQDNIGQDMKKLNTAPLVGQILKVTNEDLQSNTTQTANTLQTARESSSQIQKGQLDYTFKKKYENSNQAQQIVDNKTQQQKQQAQQYPQKRINLQLKLDDIDFYTTDNQNQISLKSNDNDLGLNMNQGIASTLSVRSAKEMVALQEGLQKNNSGPLSCSAALIKNNLRSTQHNNASPFLKKETSTSNKNNNKGIQGKLHSPQSGLIGNSKSPKQTAFNFNLEKQQVFQQPSTSPQSSSAQMKLIGNQQSSSAQVSKQLMSSSSKQSQQQLLQSFNGMGKNGQLSSTSQNSFALKLDTKESQLFTPRQPQPQPSQLVASSSAADAAKVPQGIKQLPSSSKPQISPRGLVPSPKNLESKDKLSKKNQLLNQQQQIQQQSLQQFQQQLHANTAALLRKSSSNNNNNNNNNQKINVNSFQKKNTQQLPADARQSSQQQPNENNLKSQKGQSSWKQLNLKLKLDLLDNSKEKSSQIQLNNSSSQHTFPANLHNSQNSNAPYLKDPLSQRSCSSKNMEQSTPKYNFYEMFKQQIASHGYTSVIQNNSNNNQAKNTKGSALNMLNLINAQQAQSRALAQAQQNQQQSASSSPTSRSSKQPLNMIQPPGFTLQPSTKQSLNQPQEYQEEIDAVCENQDQNPQYQVQSKISPRNSSQKGKQNCLKYILPEEKNLPVNCNQQEQAHVSPSPLQQVLSVKVVKQSKKQDNLTFNQTGSGKGSKSNKNSLDQTSQRKVVSIAPSFTARSENHTRKNSQTHSNNNKFALEKSLQQQQASIVAALADGSKQASRNSSLEINSQNPSFLRKKSPQFFKGDSNEVSKNVGYLAQNNTNSNCFQIPMSSARSYKQDGIPHTIPLPKPEVGSGGGASSGRGQLSAYHQPRPLISQAQMQLPTGQFYDFSNHESGGIPNTTGLVSNSISRLQQSGINLNSVTSRTGNQQNVMFNSSQMPSNSALSSFAILNNVSTTNHFLDQHQPYVQQQQQSCISQRILQNASSRQQAAKLQQQQQQLPQSSRQQPYSHLWQSQAQDQLNLQVQQQIFAFKPQSSTNLANFQPSTSPYSTNSGSLSVRVNPNGSGLTGIPTKLNSPKATKKVLSLHKHTKSENLLNLLSHSEVNILQNQLSSQTSYVPASKKQTKQYPSNFPSNDTTKQLQQQHIVQPSSQWTAANSPNLANMISDNNSSSSYASFQPLNINLFQSNANFISQNANFVQINNNNNNCDIYSNLIQEKQSSNPTTSNSEAMTAIVGNSHLITPRVPCNPRREGVSEKTKRETKKKQSIASPLSSRSGQMNCQREQFRSTDNSTNNNTSSQNNNNMHNPNSSSNNNSSSHQGNSSLNQQQPPTTTQPQSFTQLPPQGQATSSIAKKSSMGSQISSLFTVSPSTRNGQTLGSNMTSVLPASFISSKKIKKKSMF